MKLPRLRSWALLAIIVVGFLATISFPFGRVLTVNAETETAQAQIISLNEDTCPTDPNKICVKATISVNDEVYGDIAIREGTLNDLSYEQFSEGDFIIVSKSEINGDVKYNYLRAKRTSPFIFLVAAFLIIIILIGGEKGWRSVISLGISTVLIFVVMLPLFIQYPRFVLLIGVMTAFSIYCLNQLIGHGFNKESAISIAGGAIAFLIVLVISITSSYLFKISGFGDEGSLFIKQLLPNNFRLGDLFIVGILFGLSGAVDDVNATQTSSISEMVDINNGITPAELFARGMKIGRTHMVSIINTLFLAYIGAALPTMILFNLLDESALNIIGRDDITEEILRTIVASIGLLLAIPVTTWLSVIFFCDPHNYTLRHRLIPFSMTKSAEADSHSPEYHRVD